LSCGGTLHKAINEGKTVVIIDLTRGELGTRGSVEIRKEEASTAAKILGVHKRENLEFPDGFVFNTKENQLEIIKKIRQYQPEIVFCNAIDDRHSDHAKSSALVRDACFLSGLLKIETQDTSGGLQESWRPNAVYSYIQWKNITPDFVVDISSTIDVKMASVAAYASQFFDPNSKAPETPISTKNFIESVRYRAADLGRLVNTSYAEGFTSDRLLAVESIFDLK
jgi:bacillithiol biosynthesis deacetylase BshB1